MSAVVAGPAQEALRAATTAAHLRLHALPDFDGLETGTFTRVRYRDLLVKLHGFHAPMDHALLAQSTRFAAHGIDVRARSRIAALEDDLRALDADPAASPRWRGPDTVPSTAAWFGWFYMREGATLGARVIARRLDALFGPDIDGRRFFTGDGAEGVRWKAACAALERVAVDEGAIDDLADGARAAFEAFEGWMR